LDEQRRREEREVPEVEHPVAEYEACPLHQEEEKEKRDGDAVSAPVREARVAATRQTRMARDFCTTDPAAPGPTTLEAGSPVPGAVARARGSSLRARGVSRGRAARGVPPAPRAARAERSTRVCRACRRRDRRSASPRAGAPRLSPRGFSWSLREG